MPKGQSLHRLGWMSKGFILFIKEAMFCLLEKHTEIFIDEMM
jgi:hypothetical protein